MKRFIPAVVALMCLGLTPSAAAAATAAPAPSPSILPFAVVRLQDGNGAGDCAALQADRESPGQPYTTVGCAAVPSDTFVLALVDFVRTTGGGWPWAGTRGLALDQLYKGEEVIEIQDSDQNGCMTTDFGTQRNVIWEPCTAGFQQFWVDNVKAIQFVNVGATTSWFGIPTFLCGVPRTQQLVVEDDSSCNTYRSQWKTIFY
jgi:hypothetical protein